MCVAECSIVVDRRMIRAVVDRLLLYLMLLLLVVCVVLRVWLVLLMMLLLLILLVLMGRLERVHVHSGVPLVTRSTSGAVE